jgi:hypothetical protein
MSEQTKYLLRAALPRLGVLFLLALPVLFSVLYRDGSDPEQMGNHWTDWLHLASMLLAIAGFPTPIGLMIAGGQLNVVDPLLILFGVPVFLLSCLVY